MSEVVEKEVKFAPGNFDSAIFVRRRAWRFSRLLTLRRIVLVGFIFKSAILMFVDI